MAIDPPDFIFATWLEQAVQMDSCLEKFAQDWVPRFSSKPEDFAPGPRRLDPMILKEQWWFLLRLAAPALYKLLEMSVNADLHWTEVLGATQRRELVEWLTKEKRFNPEMATRLAEKTIESLKVRPRDDAALKTIFTCVQEIRIPYLEAERKGKKRLWLPKKR